jgi:hypothetical protein
MEIYANKYGAAKMCLPLGQILVCQLGKMGISFWKSCRQAQARSLHWALLEEVCAATWELKSMSPSGRAWLAEADLRGCFLKLIIVFF